MVVDGVRLMARRPDAEVDASARASENRGPDGLTVESSKRSASVFAQP